jgi:hypothetical protein
MSLRTCRRAYACALCCSCANKNNLSKTLQKELTVIYPLLFSPLATFLTVVASTSTLSLTRSEVTGKYRQ